MRKSGFGNLEILGLCFRDKLFQLSLLGGALSLALALDALESEEADAQATTETPAAGTETGGTAGMKRRQGRRSTRQGRRQHRRKGEPAAPAAPAANPQ